MGKHKKRYSEEQIVKILKEIEAGISVPDTGRKYGVTEQTLYRWRQKYAGMDIAEVKRLKALEEENGRLKKIVANQAIEISVLQDVCEKK